MDQLTLLASDPTESSCLCFPVLGQETLVTLPAFYVGARGSNPDPMLCSSHFTHLTSPQSPHASL